ncbi:aldo/keto reductase [Clostridioides difficile]
MKMNKRITIKDTDLSICPIGFGTVNAGTAWGNDDDFEIIEKYIELGGNVIDCARVYTDGKAEEVLGKWITKRGKRDDLIIITKGGHPLFESMNVSRMSREEMEADLNTSLKALCVDTIDIYFYHRDDLSQPVSDLIELMESFVREGKIRYYACSNWTTERMKEADEYCKSKGYRGFVANQMLFNMAAETMKPFPDKTMVAMDNEMLEYHKTSKNLAMPYFGVCSGFFHVLAAKGEEAVKNSPYYTRENLELAARIEALREKYNATISQILLGFFFQQGMDICPLAGADNEQQLLEVMGTFDIDFDPKDFV